MTSVIRPDTLYALEPCIFTLNIFLVCNQSLGMWPDIASHPRRLDPTIELMKYSFVLYLQHSRHDVRCQPSNPGLCIGLSAQAFIPPAEKKMDTKWTLMYMQLLRQK